MSKVMWENQYRTTAICIDDYKNGVLVGRMYNPYLPDGESFRSTVEFLKKMESMLDKMKFPQSFQANRVFCPTPEPKMAPPVERLPSGTCGTFYLKVLFRQNVSWQGSVTWVEKRREESFRSVLELLLLMDSALCEESTKCKAADKEGILPFSYGRSSYETPLNKPKPEGDDII